MRRYLRLVSLSVIICGAAVNASPNQDSDYGLSWFSIDGGGGISSASSYELVGTIGEPDAGVTMSGGTYGLVGSYWAAQSSTLPPCPADITGPNGAPDRVIDVHDLLLILANWGSAGPQGDITGPDGEPDGVVDVHDLLALLGAWGPCE